MRRTPDQVVWDFVQDWIRKADGDLRAAEHLLDIQQDDYFTSAFHAQQSGEKLLKALLVRHQVPFPKTHDIQRLCELLSPPDPSIGEQLASAATLTPFGVDFRYPGQPAVDRDMARAALEEARKVEAAVRERLKDYLSQGRPTSPDAKAD